MITVRAGTYLSPSIPVEYFEMILQYLESKLGIHTTLLYESRWEGPRADREDPFLSGYLDLAWMSSTVFLRMLKHSSPIELLPVSSVHIHPRGEDHPGYYSDVIMHKDLSEKVKEFIDLRGCKWAYNCEESLSGHVITLKNLKALGENATFFGNILYSGSHLESIKMVIAKKVDAAAVDANCLALFLEHNPHVADEIVTLTSWGILPPYPFVVNAKLEDTIKNDISDCLLNMHKDPEGQKRLREFNVQKFATISVEDFDKEQLMIDSTKGLRFGTTYY
ncbi:uncharacterized protein LOC129225916 [Uloborus diversus]|uniref:uncharacterized protein LOC129225916 n=1 Tax=Uloborus diversus TaxID=327109 RepID=UPI00240A1C00|nr:uncharacterized protein LOC129225916 [Uloborus diversus]XP_054716424.1 uncharacterized protein LOC129225916 [Uloborus diversus]